METKISLITEHDYMYIRLRSGASRVNLNKLVSLTMDEQGNIIGFCKETNSDKGSP